MTSTKAAVLAVMLAVISPLVHAQSPQYRPVDAEVLLYLKRSPAYLLLYVPQPGVSAQDPAWSVNEPHNLVAEVIGELAHHSEGQAMREALGDLNVDSSLLAAIETELNGSATPRVGMAKVSKVSTFRGLEREEQTEGLDVLLANIKYYISKNRRELVLEARVGLWPRQPELMLLRNTRYPGAATRVSPFDASGTLYANRFKVAMALAEPGAGEVAVALWSENGAARAKAVISEESTILAKLIAKDLGDARVVTQAGKTPREQLDFQLAGKRVQVDRLDTGEIWAFASR